jgi:hypothetical protein
MNVLKLWVTSVLFTLRRSQKVLFSHFKLPSVFPACVREGHLLLFTILLLTFIKTHIIIITVRETNQDSKQQILFRDNFFFSDTRYESLYKNRSYLPSSPRTTAWKPPEGNLWVLWSLEHTARRHNSSSFTQCPCL